MLDHPFERPSLRARLQTERRVEIKSVFAFDMRANEGGIGDALVLVDDIGQLSLGRAGRYRLFLAIGEACHLQLDFGLGHKRADFRQTKTGAKAIEANHEELQSLQSSVTLTTPYCHHGVSSGASPPPTARPAKRASSRRKPKRAFASSRSPPIQPAHVS